MSSLVAVQKGGGKEYWFPNSILPTGRNCLTRMRLLIVHWTDNSNEPAFETLSYNLKIYFAHKGMFAIHKRFVYLKQSGGHLRINDLCGCSITIIALVLL